MRIEKRALTRVPVNFEAFINFSGEQIEVKTWNLSLRGMKCTPNRRFVEGGICQVVFVLSPEIKIEIEARVMRQCNKEAGIYFTFMEEDSFFHLKRLLELNADDADKIDADLAASMED